MSDRAAEWSCQPALHGPCSELAADKLAVWHRKSNLHLLLATSRHSPRPRCPVQATYLPP